MGVVQWWGSVREVTRMEPFQLFDVVELLAPLHVPLAFDSSGPLTLPAGQRGTVVEVYDPANVLVEFANQDGEALAIEAIRLDHVRIVARSRPPMSQPV